MHTYFQKVNDKTNTAKHYFLLLTQEGGVHVVYSAWGRIGNKLQTKRETFNTRNKARTKWDYLYSKRADNGYQEFDSLPLEILDVPTWWPVPTPKPERPRVTPADRVRAKPKPVHAPSPTDPAHTLCGRLRRQPVAMGPGTTVLKQAVTPYGQEQDADCPVCRSILAKQAQEKEESIFEKRKRTAAWNF